MSINSRMSLSIEAVARLSTRVEPIADAHPLPLLRLFGPNSVDQVWLEEPLAGTKGTNIEPAIQVATGESHELIEAASSVNNALSNWHWPNHAGDRSGRLHMVEHEVFERKARAYRLHRHSGNRVRRLQRCWFVVIRRRQQVLSARSEHFINDLLIGDGSISRVDLGDDIRQFFSATFADAGSAFTDEVCSQRYEGIDMGVAGRHRHLLKRPGYDAADIKLRDCSGPWNIKMSYTRPATARTADWPSRHIGRCRRRGPKRGAVGRGRSYGKADWSTEEQAFEAQGFYTPPLLLPGILIASYTMQHPVDIHGILRNWTVQEYRGYDQTFIPETISSQMPALNYGP